MQLGMKKELKHTTPECQLSMLQFGLTVKCHSTLMDLGTVGKTLVN